MEVLLSSGNQPVNSLFFKTEAGLRPNHLSDKINVI